MELFQRSIFWTLLIGFGVLVYHLAGIFTFHRKFPGNLRFRNAAWLATFSVLFLAVSTASKTLFLQQQHSVPIFWLVVLGTSFALVARSATGFFWLESQPLIRHPRIVERLPEELQGSLIRMTVRDHYVDVYTTKGKFALLMRFRDAANEADGVDGFCVHRSHWVARYAICKVLRENGRVFLRLTDGTRIPVSRKYRVNVEDAGLL